jgi:ABC-2 type transport system permease protein
MRAPFLLLTHSLKRVRTLVAALGSLLAVFQVFIILIAKSIQNSNAFDQMSALIPEFARDLMGPAMTSFMSFKGIVCLGYFHLSVMSALVALAITVATMPASEIETGFIDLILARPLPRHWIISRSIVVSALCIAGVLAVMMAATWAGLQMFAPPGADWPSRDLILSLGANLSLLMLCWSGVALAIASASRRRGAAGAFAGLLALGTFLLDYVARAWKPGETAGWLSPFRYYAPFDLLMGNPLPAKNLLVLAGIAVAGFLLAYVLFSRRDISH